MDKVMAAGSRCQENVLSREMPKQGAEEQDLAGERGRAGQLVQGAGDAHAGGVWKPE